ncbi:hypothetical protein GJ496_008702 [Pomphorhynchus laevis]|nr:hypothetical protein GJ496_008702 [Pomphorhynchus laevis]
MYSDICGAQYVGETELPTSQRLSTPPTGPPLARVLSLSSGPDVHRSVLAHLEVSDRTQLPDVLIVVIMLGHDRDLVRDQICRVEAYSKLPNHDDVGSALEGLYNGTRPTASNRAQIVHHVALL